MSIRTPVHGQSDQKSFDTRCNSPLQDGAAPDANGKIAAAAIICQLSVENATKLIKTASTTMLSRKSVAMIPGTE
jgi:hypothetical protein